MNKNYLTDAVVFRECFCFFVFFFAVCVCFGGGKGKKRLMLLRASLVHVRVGKQGGVVPATDDW